MKNFIKNAITKKILIVFITIIMVSNFIIPNYVQASIGGDLVEGISYLIAWLGDIGIKTMQDIMIGYKSIQEPDADGVNRYAIRYSPGIIFSNTVPALDINFINPMGENRNEFQVWGDAEISGGGQENVSYTCKTSDGNELKFIIEYGANANNKMGYFLKVEENNRNRRHIYNNEYYY